MSPRLVGVGPDRFLTAARRVMARCDELARVTATPGEGIERVYLSPEHARVNRLAAQWMREIGMTAHQDAAGNQVGRMLPANGDPDAPALLLGSHLDTVLDAGRFDGIAGVLMALEVVRLLRTPEMARRAPSFLSRWRSSPSPTRKEPASAKRCSGPRPRLVFGMKTGGGSPIRTG